MFWLKNNVEQVKSGFYEGFSMISNSFNGFYNSFIQSIEKAGLVMNDLQIPKIVMIGAESSGKSSLLENIIKCELFPKNSNFCTKIPIHLILKQVNNINEVKYALIYKNEILTTKKEEIYDQIKKIMEQMNNIDIENEITIEICDVNVVNFEFYDLPGIRAYPPELKKQTEDICNKYLSMNNVIPICVIPATTPRITSYVPLALIKQHNKESTTVICLSMCDLISDYNIEELLINRIINNTDEFTGTQFAGICAIINRIHKNNISLTTHDRIENDWFYNNILCNMPETYEHKNLINTRIGIKNLVNLLSNNYHEFVKKNWIPKTIEKMHEQEHKIKKEIVCLGFEPNLTYQQIFKKFVSSVYLPIFVFELFNKYLNFKQINDICQTIDSDIDSDILSNHVCHISNKNIIKEIFDKNTEIRPDQLIIELHNAKDITCFDMHPDHLLENIKSNVINEKFDLKNLFKKLKNYVSYNNFQQKYSILICPKRFEYFFEELNEIIYCSIVTQIEVEINHYMTNIKYDYLSLESSQYNNKIKLFIKNILYEFCKNTLIYIWSGSCLTEKQNKTQYKIIQIQSKKQTQPVFEWLIENEKTIKIRKELHSKLEDIKESIKNVKNINELINV